MVPGAAGGQFIAGLIAKCANMRVRQMLHLCVGATVVATVFVISILTHCSSDPLAGVNVAYDDRYYSVQSSINTFRSRLFTKCL